MFFDLAKAVEVRSICNKIDIAAVNLQRLSNLICYLHFPPICPLTSPSLALHDALGQPKGEVYTQQV